ncbi:MAG: PDZ domain-containing protein [Magnetococcus sp. DMHC-8]
MHIRYAQIVCAVTLLLLTRMALAAGWLGVTTQPPQGVQVAEIFKEGPADRSGLRKGDLIRAIDEIPIRSMDHFNDLIAQAPAGKEVTLTLWRRGEELRIKTTLDNGADHAPLAQTTLPAWPQPAPGGLAPLPGPRPAIGQPPGERRGPTEWSTPPLPREEPLRPPAPTAWLGVAPGVAPGGVAIVDVAPHSPAEQAELRAGDIIIAINRQAIASPDALVQALAVMRPGDLVEIAFDRDGRTFMSQVQLQRAPVNP